LAAAEAGQCVISHSVYLKVDVETSAVPPLAMADLSVETHFFLRKNRLAVPAFAAAGLSAVAAVFGATLPFASEGARWVSFELVTDVVVSASGPSRCLCCVVVE
jgi:hypothetical protein